MILRALLLIGMISIVAGQRGVESSRQLYDNDESQTKLPINPTKTLPRGNLKKVIKVNKLSKTNFPKTTSIGVHPSLLQTTERILTLNPLPTASPTPRLTRQNQQTQGRRVLRKSSNIDGSDAQSQASSPKQTYLIGDDLDDDYFSRRRARFLFKSRVGK